MLKKRVLPKRCDLLLLRVLAILLLLWPATSSTASDIRCPAPCVTTVMASVEDTAAASTERVKADSLVLFEMAQTQPFELTKEADRKVYCPGNLITYTITLRNTSQRPVPATIKDNVPQATTFVSATEDGAFDPSPAPGMITWELSSVETTATVSYTVRVNCTIKRGTTISNQAQATISAGGAAPIQIMSNRVEIDSSRRCPPCLEKSVDKTSVCPGDFLTYTITARNSDSSPVGPLQVVDQIPAGTSFVAANMGGMFQPAPPPGQVVWTIALIPGNTTITLSFTVQMDCDARPRTRILNQASLTDASGVKVLSNQVTSTVSSRCPPASFPCDGPPWAETELTLDHLPPILGQPNRICATIVNNTNRRLTNCTLIFGVLPFGFGAPFTTVGTQENVMLEPGENTICVPYVPTFSGHTCVQVIIQCPGFPDQISQRNLENREVIEPGASDSLQFVICNPDNQSEQTIETDILANCDPGISFALSNPNPTLGPGECIVETLTVNVDPDVRPGTICTVDVVGHLNEQLIGGVRKKITVGTSRCVIRKRADRQLVCPGDLIKYTIEVICKDDVKTLLVKDFVPADTTFVAASAPGAFDPMTGEVSWIFHNVNMAEMTMEVRVNATASPGSTIINIAQLEAPTSRSSIPVSVTVSRECASDIVVLKNVDKQDVCPGDFLTYTISIKNNTASLIGPLNVVDPVPVGTTFVSANMGGMFTAAPPPGQVSWAIASLAPGAGVDLSMTVQVPCDAQPGTQIVNRAVVTMADGTRFVSNPVVSVVSRECPPVTHPCDGPPWAETSVTLESDPPIVGRPNQICAQIMNNTTGPISPCTLLFGVLPVGFGAAFSPVATLANVTLQPGANTLCVPYMPMFSGDTCVQVIIRCPGFPDQISQRNIDNNEIIPPGGSDSLEFTVCNPNSENSHDMALNVLADCPPGVDVSLSESRLSLAPGECKTVTITVDVSANVPVGTMCMFDVVGYLSNALAATLVGGVRKKITVGSPLCVIRKLADKEAACPGDTITYRIEVECQDEIETLLITDKVPAHTRLIATSPGGSFSAITGEVSWVVTNAGAASLSMTVRVDSTVPIPGVITNRVQLQSPLSASSNVVSVQVPRTCPTPGQLCINFDTFLTGAAIASGTYITTQYRSLGVDFSRDDDADATGLVTVSAPFAISPPNVVMAGHHLGNMMAASFYDPKTKAPAVTDFVSITTDNDTVGGTEKLIGYDVDGNVVATAKVDFSMPGQVVSISTETPMIYQVQLVTSDFFDEFCFAPLRPAAGAPSQSK